MASEGSEARRVARRSGRETGREPVCPTCGQSVGTVVRRRKVLGAWVPEWHPLPCDNPACARYAEGAGEHEMEPGKRAETA